MADDGMRMQCEPQYATHGEVAAVEWAVFGDDGMGSMVCGGCVGREVLAMRAAGVRNVAAHALVNADDTLTAAGARLYDAGEQAANAQ